MGNPRCNWVRDRLPLSAGDELAVSDRRQVERHLIGCLECRQHREALGRALDVLHAASAASPSHHDAPSLWPALQRQIRESRRPAAAPEPSPWFGFGLGFGLRTAFGLGLALGLGLLTALGLATALRHQNRAVPTRVAQAAPTIPAPIATPAPAPVVEIPEPSPEAPKVAGDLPLPEATAGNRLKYDLDHGTPMSTEPHDRKQPTY